MNKPPPPTQTQTINQHETQPKIPQITEQTTHSPNSPPREKHYEDDPPNKPDPTSTDHTDDDSEHNETITDDPTQDYPNQQAHPDFDLWQEYYSIQETEPQQHHYEQPPQPSISPYHCHICKQLPALTSSCHIHRLCPRCAGPIQGMLDHIPCIHCMTHTQQQPADPLENEIDIETELTHEIAINNYQTNATNNSDIPEEQEPDYHTNPPNITTRTNQPPGKQTPTPNTQTKQTPTMTPTQNTPEKPHTKSQRPKNTHPNYGKMFTAIWQNGSDGFHRQKCFFISISEWMAIHRPMNQQTRGAINIRVMSNTPDTHDNTDLAEENTNNRIQNLCNILKTDITIYKTNQSNPDIGHWLGEPCKIYKANTQTKETNRDNINILNWPEHFELLITERDTQQPIPEEIKKRMIHYNTTHSTQKSREEMTLKNPYWNELDEITHTRNKQNQPNNPTTDIPTDPLKGTETEHRENQT